MESCEVTDRSVRQVAGESADEDHESPFVGTWERRGHSVLQNASVLLGLEGLKSDYLREVPFKDHYTAILNVNL